MQEIADINLGHIKDETNMSLLCLFLPLKYTGAVSVLQLCLPFCQPIVNVTCHLLMQK